MALLGWAVFHAHIDHFHLTARLAPLSKCQDLSDLSDETLLICFGPTTTQCGDILELYEIAPLGRVYPGREQTQITNVYRFKEGNLYKSTQNPPLTLFVRHAELNRGNILPYTILYGTGQTSTRYVGLSRRRLTTASRHSSHLQ